MGSKKRELRREFKGLLQKIRNLKDDSQYNEAIIISANLVSDKKYKSYKLTDKDINRVRQLVREILMLATEPAKQLYSQGHFAQAICSLQELPAQLDCFPQEHLAIIQFQTLILMAAKSKTPQDILSHDIIDDGVLPPSLLCNESYLAEKALLLSQHSSKMKEDYAARIAWVLRLIEFLRQNMLKTGELFPFLKEEYFTDSAASQQLRFSTLADKIICLFDKPVKNMADCLNMVCEKTFRNAANDYYFEDSVMVLRMVFETIYRFPRNERGLLVQYLPWGENSWYLLDFLSAIFETGDVFQTNGQAGLTIAPYNFNHNLEKQRQLIQFHSAMTHFKALVRHYLADILAKDMDSLYNFFRQIQEHHAKGTPITPLEKPKNLQTLLWFSKHSFLTLRLIALLPQDREQAFYDAEIIEENGISVETLIKNYDEDTLLNWLKNAKDNIISVKELMQQSQKANGQNAPVFSKTFSERVRECEEQQKLSLCVMKDSNQLSPHTRLQIHGYKNFDSIKNRLSLLRTLEHIGEFFMPRNWGNKLKNLDLIDVELIGKIRNGLCHPEDWQYITVLNSLEKDPVLIQKLHDELKIFRGAVYELIVSRESQLNWQVRDTKTGYDDWKKDMELYKQSIVDFYHPPKKTQVREMENPLLNDKKLEELSNLIDPAHRETLTKCFGKDVTFFFEKNTSPLSEFLDVFTKGLNIQQTRKVRATLTAADKSFRKFKKEVDNKEKNDAALHKKRLKEKQTEAMDTLYPVIKQVAKSFWAAESHHSNSVTATLDNLINRLELLGDLLVQEQITSSSIGSLQVLLEEKMKDDIKLSQSIAYLLGQIISGLNKLAGQCNLKEISPVLHSRLDDLIPLRNALEHSDPFLESSETSFYNMSSPLTKFMACVVGEIVFEYRYSIILYQTTLLMKACSTASTTPASGSLLLPEDSKTKQRHALRESGFQFAVTEEPATEPSYEIDLLEASSDDLMNPYPEKKEQKTKLLKPGSLSRSCSGVDIGFFKTANPDSILSCDLGYHGDEDLEMDYSPM